jgi:hypothetical protein
MISVLQNVRSWVGIAGAAYIHSWVGRRMGRSSIYPGYIALHIVYMKFEMRHRPQSLEIQYVCQMFHQRKIYIMHRHFQLWSLDGILVI